MEYKYLFLRKKRSTRDGYARMSRYGVGSGI
jgi:hypothetical protein